MSTSQLFSRRADVAFRNADGRTLRLSSTHEQFSNPCDSTIRVSPKVLDGTRSDVSQVLDLHVAYAGNYDSIMSDLLDARVEQRLSSQGGEILVARSSRSDLQGLALWRGKYFEVASWLPPEPESDGIDPIARFAGLVFTDTEDGLLVGSAWPDTRVDIIETVTDIAGVGTLFMFPAEDSLGRVPTWKGAPIRVGELWSTQIQDSPDSEIQYRFAVATPTVYAVLAPSSQAKAPYAEQLNFLESLVRLDLHPAEKVN